MLRPPVPHAFRQPAAANNGDNGEALVWYLAFGSNMASSTLTGRRRVAPLRSLPAIVPRHALSFDMLGLPFSEPAFAVLQRLREDGGGRAPQPQPWWPAELRSRRRRAAPAAAGTSRDLVAPPRPPPTAHGVLHLVTLEDWRRVLASEGVLGGGGEGQEEEEEEDGNGGAGAGAGYRVARVRCLAYAPCARDLEIAGPRKEDEDEDDSAAAMMTSSGASSSFDHLPAVDALTLLSSASSPQHAAQGRRALPSRRYLEILQKGAREHGLSPHYRRYLNSLAFYEPSASPSAAAARAGLLAAGAAAAAAAPALPLVAVAGALAAGRGGNEVLASYANLAQRALWSAHDALAPLLGDGGGELVGGGGDDGGSGGSGGSGF